MVFIMMYDLKSYVVSAGLVNDGSQQQICPKSQQLAGWLVVPGQRGLVFVLRYQLECETSNTIFSW